MSGAARSERRIGILGAGHVGRALYRHLRSGDVAGLAPAFVWARTPAALDEVLPEHRLGALADAARSGADLIVEAAHPDLTRAHGAALLAAADYMPLSVSALADDALADRLRQAAKAAGRRLWLPVGALVGGHALAARRSEWVSVTITFRKNPASIDFSASGIDPATIRGETVVFDGPVRAIGRMFPRNVNTMLTCALATVGLDRTRGRLIADPALTHGIAEVEAVARDGAVLRTEKRQPMVGVSGTEMVASVLRSVRLATGALDPVEIV